MGTASVATVTTAVILPCVNINPMFPLEAINVQHGSLHLHRSQRYWQLGIKRSKPHPTCVFSWPLFYLFLSGAELKGSMTTSQAQAQCVARGQEGRYTSACSGGFLRTSTHWAFLIILWLHARIRKGTIQMHGTGPKGKTEKKDPMSDWQRRGWPFGNFHCTYTEGSALPLSSGFPSALPVTQACAFIYSNWPAAEKIRCVLHGLFKRL